MHYFYSKYLFNGLKVTFLGKKFWKKCHSTQKYSFIISKRVVETSHFWRGRGNCQEVVQKYIPFTHLNVKKTDKYSF